MLTDIQVKLILITSLANSQAKNSQIMPELKIVSFLSRKPKLLRRQELMRYSAIYIQADIHIP